MYYNRSKRKEWGASLSEAQMRLARRMQDAGLDTISQIVKAFERRDSVRIAELKARLAEHDAANGQPWRAE